LVNPFGDVSQNSLQAGWFDVSVTTPAQSGGRGAAGATVRGLIAPHRRSQGGGSIVCGSGFWFLLDAPVGCKGRS
jgi:hypothetical protein